MKFTASCLLALAPLAMARQVRNSYPGRRFAPSSVVDKRTSHGESAMDPIVMDPMSGHELVTDPLAEHGLAGALPTEVTVGHSQVIVIWVNPGAGAETSTVNEKVTVTQTVTAGVHETVAAPAAASHTVTVGGPGGLIFQPDALHEVPMGDMVIFEFLSENHTVTQSPFDTPCLALDGGMDTGFQPNPENSVSPPPQVAMQVMTADPLWFYCKQGNHCGSGMVFSINPTAEKTQAMFQQMAIAQNGEGAAAPITGGEGAPPEDAPVEEAPVEEAPVETPAEGGVTPGNGQLQEDGSCFCMVTCEPGSFPSSIQGRAAQGGWAGSMPMNLITGTS